MWPLKLYQGEGVPNNAGKFVVIALTLFGPTDLEQLSQNHTESRYLPELPAYVEDWLLYLFLSVHLREAAQYLSNEHLSPKSLVLLEIEILEVSDCWQVHSSSYWLSMTANIQRSPSIRGWWPLLWKVWMAEQGSCDKERREGSSLGTRGPLGPQSLSFSAKQQRYPKALLCL